MQQSNEWFATAENTDMGIVIVRGRLHLDTARTSGHYPSRVEIQWQIKGDDKGMPTDTEAEVIDRIMGIACESLERSNTALLTAIHTGARQVRYTFYATGANALADKVQTLFAAFGKLPIRIGAVSDPDWTTYIALIASQATRID